MRIKYKASSAFIILCFFLNITISDISHGLPINEPISDNDLSVASLCNDLLGIEHKDIGRIKISLEAQDRL